MSFLDSFDRLTVKRKLWVLIGIFVAMYVGFAVLAYQTIAQVQHAGGQAAAAVASNQLLLATLAVGMLAVVTLGFGAMLMTSISRTLDETINALSTTSVEIASAIQQHERTAMTQA